MIDRRFLNSFDGWFVMVLLLILTLGVLSIYTVTNTVLSKAHLAVYEKQMVWIALGGIVFFIAAFVDYHEIARFAAVFYVTCVVLLILVLLVGRTGMGARRWLSLGFFDLQPSEWIKLVVILVLARYFSTRCGPHGLGLWELIVPAVGVGIPLVLVLKQPDLGTAMVLVFILSVMVFLVGLRSKTVGSSILVLLMAFPFIWEIFWGVLKPYQRNRLIAFVNPAVDPMGRGYHALQSKIAIGSGGWFGKGLFGGTQSQLKFLPEGHTDFVFSVFAEEWGFVGVLVLLLLYFLLIAWGIDVAYKAKDALGVFLAVGVVAMLAFYLAVNIGMTLGIVPVVGVPLPLMSYGGNSILTTMTGLGLLLNIKMRRFMLFY
ncbi:MAG: rod shape-determining protein RodA [Nitrospirae bacterium]|nr:rod shape-determining protein RodA [Nitrospirota bacterium]